MASAALLSPGNLVLALEPGCLWFGKYDYVFLEYVVTHAYVYTHNVYIYIYMYVCLEVYIWCLSENQDHGSLTFLEDWPGPASLS